MEATAIPAMRAVLLDLGDTLMRSGAVLSGVPDALELLSVLTTKSGDPIRIALVSDYTEAATPGDVDRLFGEYVQIIRKLGILRFFEPPEEHVTLSTQAGANKPDRRVFELAMERLGLPTVLSTAVFVTENADHIAAARALGLRALRFGPGGDFDDWTRAIPVLLSALGFEDPEVAEKKGLEMLEANRLVAHPGEPVPRGATHALVPDESGALELKRRRFSIL